MEELHNKIDEVSQAAVLLVAVAVRRRHEVQS